jgi:hypothetical protein
MKRSYSTPDLFTILDDVKSCIAEYLDEITCIALYCTERHHRWCRRVDLPSKPTALRLALETPSVEQFEWFTRLCPPVLLRINWLTICDLAPERVAFLVENGLSLPSDAQRAATSVLNGRLISWLVQREGTLKADRKRACQSVIKTGDVAAISVILPYLENMECFRDTDADALLNTTYKEGKFERVEAAVGWSEYYCIRWTKY